MKEKLLKVKYALNEIHEGMPLNDGDYYTGWAHEYGVKAKETEALIDSILAELDSPDGWQPLHTIPKEIVVYLINNKGEIDTGKWCDYTDRYGFDETKDLHGEISSTHELGDYTGWRPLT